MKQPVQRLSPAQRAVVDRTVREVLTHNGWQLHSLRVMTEHVHVVLSAAKKPDEVMDSLKSWCTRRLREEGLLESTIRPWSRHGSTRYLWDEEAVRDACAYVEAHG
jgi:REP element-mobilizing transposase RayT